MISSVIVFIYLPGQTQAVPAGRLTLTQLGQDISSKFVYGTRYVARPNAISLDPFSLNFKANLVSPNEELTPQNRLKLFGAFRDATPDSWGRRVIEKHLGTASLPEIEYVRHSFRDRVGALDFRDTPDAAPFDPQRNRPLDLQYLYGCADKIDNDEPVPEDILRLFHYGSSMGGARPKAVVEDDSGLWLAKFKSRNDRFDYSTVEFATLKLAQLCEIAVPEIKLESLADSSVFMIKRFDREKLQNGYARTHFVSALTLLGKDETESLGASYLEILEAIAKYGSGNLEKMKLELFRRMVFNVIVHNNDDHLRNHGFVYRNGGYRLSDAYDIVPSPSFTFERYQHLRIGKQGRLSTLTNALSQCEAFGLTRQEGHDIVRTMLAITGRWQDIFMRYGVSKKDIGLLGTAFRSPSDMGLA